MHYIIIHIEFDHATANIEQFNNELSILVNHFKYVSDDKKISQDLIGQMTYIVELLHKNQAPKNIATKARVIIIVYLIVYSCLNMVSFLEIMNSLTSS